MLAIFTKLINTYLNNNVGLTVQLVDIISINETTGLIKCRKQL